MNKRFFEIAANIAVLRKDRRSFYIGAVGVRKDGVYVAASNMAVSMPDTTNSKGFFAKAHAEFRVSRKLDFGAEVYVVRIRKGDGKICNARPCKTCRNFLRKRGVKKVYYSIDEHSGKIEYGTLIP